LRDVDGHANHLERTAFRTELAQPVIDSPRPHAKPAAGLLVAKLDALPDRVLVLPEQGRRVLAHDHAGSSFRFVLPLETTAGGDADARGFKVVAAHHMFARPVAPLLASQARERGRPA